MHPDRHQSDHPRPSADAFRDSVLHEDPSHWSSHLNEGSGHSPATPPPAGWGHPTAVPPGTVATTPTVDTTPTQGAITGDPAPATYVPPREPVMERERERITDPRADAEAPVGRPTFSLGATFLGWTVAAFFTVLFSAAVLLLVGGVSAVDGVVNFENFAVGNLIGYLVAAFLAYLIGGYAAGRISLWNGIWHGLGTVAWAVLFAVLAAVGGTYFADQLGFVSVGAIDLEQLGGFGVLAIALSLLAMLAGAALGGRLGERYHHAADYAMWRRHEARGERGRAF